MRLRKETGDFHITISEGAATLPKNLKAFDLLGYIVINGANASAITSAETAVGGATITLTAGSASYTYTVATGAVAAVQASNG